MIKLAYSSFIRLASLIFSCLDGCITYSCSHIGGSVLVSPSNLSKASIVLALDLPMQ